MGERTKYKYPWVIWVAVLLIGSLIETLIQRASGYSIAFLNGWFLAALAYELGILTISPDDQAKGS